MRLLAPITLSAALVALTAVPATAAHYWSSFSDCTFGDGMHAGAQVYYRGWTTFAVTSADGDRHVWHFFHNGGDGSHRSRWLESEAVTGAWMDWQGWPTRGKAGKSQDIDPASKGYCVL